MGPKGTQEGTKEQEAQGILRNLHLQSSEASAPRYWSIFQGNEYHEFIRQRYFRAHCSRSFPFGSLQQKEHHHVARDSNCCFFYSLESWPSMLCLKVPRRLRNIPRQSNLLKKNLGPFQGQQQLWFMSYDKF